VSHSSDRHCPAGTHQVPAGHAYQPVASASALDEVAVPVTESPGGEPRGRPVSGPVNDPNGSGTRCPSWIVICRRARRPPAHASGSRRRRSPGHVGTRYRNAPGGLEAEGRRAARQRHGVVDGLRHVHHAQARSGRLGQPGRRPWADLARVYAGLRDAVASAATPPVVLSGDCVASLAVVAGPQQGGLRRPVPRGPGPRGDEHPDSKNAGP
jgi:hypothetical protein